MLTFARIGIILAVVLAVVTLMILGIEVYSHEQQKDTIEKLENKASEIDKRLGIENRSRINELCFMAETHGAETLELDARIRRLENIHGITPPADYPNVLRAPSCK